MKQFLTIAVFLFASVQSALAFDVMDRRGELIGWEAIGRVNIGRKYCTGTLISRDVVMTAAHCVYMNNGKTVPPKAVRFMAGYHHGQAIVTRNVTKVVVAPGYNHSDGGPFSADAMSRDVALLKLDRKVVSSEADPFKLLEGINSSKDVSVVSYGRGRDNVLSREAKCNILHSYPRGIVSLNCDVTFGTSGAPVFVKQDGLLRILAVVSALGNDNDGKKIAFAVLASDIVDELLAELSSDGSRPKPSDGAKRITIGQRSGGGARFVKP